MLRCPNRAAELRCIFRHAGQYLLPFLATKRGNVIPAIGLGRLFLDKVEQDIEHFHDLITSSTPLVIISTPSSNGAVIDAVGAGR